MKEEILNHDIGKGTSIPSLSTDSVIFCCHDGQLKVLLNRYAYGRAANQWALPGGDVFTNESAEQAASRVLNQHTGLRDIFLEQLHAFSDVERVDHSRVITVAFYALVRPEEHEIVVSRVTSDVVWRDIHELPQLIYDHRKIIELAIERLRHKVRHEPIGFNLLSEKFTLAQLQSLYETILGIKLDKPNFRRKMLKMNLLVSCNEKQQGVSYRAANLYRFDPSVYERLKLQGFAFVV